MFAVANLFLSLPALAKYEPPTKPVVIDDGAYTSSFVKLHAKWTSASPESGSVKFRYQIRKGSTLGPIIVGWQSVGLATEFTHLGLSLFNGKTYYIGVKAINSEGKTSDVGYSDGIPCKIVPHRHLRHRLHLLHHHRRRAGYWKDLALKHRVVRGSLSSLLAI